MDNHRHEGDRRVRRTRQLLQDALVELILEKGYTEVTVQDILDRADLGRSTFYAHYRDKDDLLFSQFESIGRAFEDHNRGVDLTLRLFQHAATNRRFYRALLGKQGNDMINRHVRHYLFLHIHKHLQGIVPAAKQATIPLDAVAYYMVDSFFAVLVWWLDSDSLYTAEQIDGLFKRLTMPGLYSVLEFPADLQLAIPTP